MLTDSSQVDRLQIRISQTAAWQSSSPWELCTRINTRIPCVLCARVSISREHLPFSWGLIKALSKAWRELYIYICTALCKYWFLCYRSWDCTIRNLGVWCNYHGIISGLLSKDNTNIMFRRHFGYTITND